MKKLKVISILLLSFILLQMFAACGNNAEKSQQPTSDRSNTGTEDISGEQNPDQPAKLGFSVSSIKENIPDDVDLKGRDFTILIGDPSEKVWTYTNMVVGEETGDTIDDAYYMRNLLVEDRLNIKIKQVTTALSGAQSRFRKTVESRDNSFDIAMVSYNDAANLATGNYCVALNDVPYIDFEKPWWDKGSLRDLSISNRNYLMASDISIGDNDNTWLIYFDKQMVEDFGLESPYNLVEQGKWTFDKMYEMMRAAYRDVNSDGKMNKEDQFGLLTHGENYAGMWIAANQTLIAKDADDMPYIAFNNEKFFNVWVKIIEMMNDLSCKADDIEFISTGLANGQTLFGTEILKFVRNYRANDRNFGIIPMPKLDEAQDSYHTYVAVSAPLLLIPGSNNDLETTGLIVEAMAAEGHRTIMPAYYEVSIEGKAVRDVESIAMLDIAFATRKYDLGVVFNWGSMNSELTSTYGPKNNPNVMSLIEKRGESMQKAIDKTFSAFNAD